MSSSRSIAAARQRRGVESAPPIKNNSYASNSSSKDNFNNNQQNRPNYRTTKSNIYQDNNTTSNMNNNTNANQVSKLSVSDAFALVTLRLGRVELIINKLQSEGILDANNNINSENLGNNNNNFDDTILQNIITRLDGLDKKTVSNDLNQKLQSQYNVLSEDVKQTKEVVIKLQSFIMDISQKMNSFITTQESINEEFFDLRDDFHSSVLNDVSNTIPENDINKQIENEETVVDENITQQDNVVAVSEIQENNETFENQNLDSLIANNLDNFTETTTNNTVEQVTTTAEIPKNKQKNNKTKTMNVNV
uniref:Uncharacterized protein n=1 Tax=viral metagenome TaxID=1070528 RepID=A0A6C0EJG8_9ZZZZ